MLLQRFIMSACLMGAYTVGIILGGPQEATFNAVGSDGIATLCNGNFTEGPYDCTDLSAECDENMTYTDIRMESPGTELKKHWSYGSMVCVKSGSNAHVRNLCKKYVLFESGSCVKTYQPITDDDDVPNDE